MFKEFKKEERKKKKKYFFTSNMRKSLLFRIYNNIPVAKYNLTYLLCKTIVRTRHDTSKQWASD